MAGVRQKNWKVGDRVCFAHDTRTAYHVSRLVPNEPMLELDEMVGQFGDHLFVEPPTPSNAEEKQEDSDLETPCGGLLHPKSEAPAPMPASDGDAHDLKSVTRKLAGWIEHSLGGHSLHVAIPVDMAKFIHGVLLSVASRKKPYSTPQLTGPFSRAELEIIKAEATWLDLAKGAYGAYGQSTGNKNFRGDEMPRWEELPEAIRTAWKAAAKFVFDQIV